MCNGSSVFGNTPANIKWEINRGDSAELKIQFFESDEVTFWDTEGWDFVASAYDPVNDAVEELETFLDEDGIRLRVDSNLSAEWGSGFGKVVLNLPFDLKAIIPGNPENTWTIISGTIVVNADVSSGL